MYCFRKGDHALWRKKKMNVIVLRLNLDNMTPPNIAGGANGD